MLAHGILHRGLVLPGSERVLRDPTAWWMQGRETRPRIYPIDLGLGHWTAGPHREGLLAGRYLHRAMEARRSADGSRDLSVSVHFGISWDGFIFQFLDLHYAAVHVGDRSVNGRSWSAEMMWCGLSSLARRLGIQHTPMRRTIAGMRTLDICPLSDRARDAWVWLCNFLQRLRHPDFAIPRVVAPTRRLERSETRSLRGIGEHMHIHGTTKIDTQGLLCDALREDGWSEAA